VHRRQYDAPHLGESHDTLPNRTRFRLRKMPCPLKGVIGDYKPEEKKTEKSASNKK